MILRQASWKALVEAKIGPAAVSEEQVYRYGELARLYGIDAVVTLSNQLVSLPSHVPYPVPKKLSKNVQFFHVSWISLLTQAHLILQDKEDIKPDVEQAYILGEMVRYFEHQQSGIKRFEQMNKEWSDLVLGVRNQRQFTASSLEIENTIASWCQEERDVCLILTRRIGERIQLRLSPKHRLDPARRHRDACELLAARRELKSVFVIPNAADDLKVIVNLDRRTISCSMGLKAPLDKKRASGRINWLVRQLRKVESSGIFVRVFWPGRTIPTQGSLHEVQIDPKCLDYGKPSLAPKGFEVLMIKDCAGQFSKRRNFIRDLEEVVPDFYERVGQRIRRWVPPPPSVEKKEEGVATDSLEEKADSGQLA